jgi:hypothetical protein
LAFIRWALLHHATTPLGLGCCSPNKGPLNGAHYLGYNPTLMRYPYTKLAIKYLRRQREETQNTYIRSFTN